MRKRVLECKRYRFNQEIPPWWDQSVWRGACGDATPIRLASPRAPETILVYPLKSVDATVKAPPSKSYTHRAVFAALHSPKTSTIIDPLYSGDTLATIEAARAFGAEATLLQDRIILEGRGGEPLAPRLVYARGSATTLRLAMSVAALQDKPVLLLGDDSLNRRPVEPLATALRGLGASVETSGGNPPVTVSGPLRRGAHAVVDAGLSSQYASSLLMILSPAGLGGLEITRLSSRPYLDITVRVMEAFGLTVDVVEPYRLYRVRGSYRGAEYRVPGDYSSAGYLLALGALLGRVVVRGLDPADVQPDKRILEVLSAMGARVSWTGDGVEVEAPRRLEPFHVDVEDSPDLAPTLAVLAAYARGTSTIEGTRRLAIKESNRAQLIAVALQRMGAGVELGEDRIIVHGRGGLAGGVTVDAGGDHRIAMSLAIASLAAEKPTRITGSSRIGDSYPGFLADLASAGARIEALE